MIIEWYSDWSCALSEWDDVEQLLTFRSELRSAGLQVLFVLDDFDQALYQSGHVTSDLWLIGEEDRTEYSAIMTGWLAGQLVDASVEGNLGLIPIDDRDIALLRHLDDVDAVFRSPLRCYTVESLDPSMAIAAEPNGYFRGDLTPAQNYLLAETLRKSFGLEIFGLGASFAAYCRSEPLELSEAQEVVDSVKGMYRGMTSELAAQWAAKTAGRRWFLLSYRGA